MMGRLAIRVPLPLVFTALLFRTVLFTVFAVLFAFMFSLLESSSPWDESVRWWSYHAILASFLTFLFLRWLIKRENVSYLQFIGFQKERWLKDIGLALLYAVIGGVGGAIGLYGSSFLIFWDMPPDTMFQPLPVWAAVLGLVLMPLLIAATESPLYIGYALPHLQKLVKSDWLAVFIVSFALAFQHIALPLVFDWQFMLWRLLSFFPIAIILAVIFLKTKRLFPLMIAHFLMDLQVMMIILSVSLG